VVGGAVRDLVDGREPGDFDIATDALPSDVKVVFRRVIPTGIKHGTVTVLVKGESIEVTTFRTESAYSDRRHPDSVEFVPTLEEDLSRRDFTFNGMAIDPVNEKFTDPFGGAEDLRSRIVRAIGPPLDRFNEDSLRLLRAIRFATQFEASIEPETFDALRTAAPNLLKVSAERIRDELVKILSSRRPSRGFRLMRDSNTLQVVVPELSECIGVEQRGLHRFDVFDHSLMACDAAPADSLDLRLSALFHDIGKPRSLEVLPDGTRTFHGHDRLSSEMTAAILRRLRFSNAVIDRVTTLIRHHMFSYTPEWTDAAVRRFLARVGRENVDDLMELRRADSEARTGEPADLRGLAEMGRRISSVTDAEHALTISDLSINGNDLADAGIPKGRAMGTVLEHLLETVLDDPALNRRDRLTEIAVKFYQTRIREAGGKDT